MIDQTMPSLASEPQRSSALQLPLQAAPIDRSHLPTSAVAADGGVEAAFGVNDVIDIASKIPWGSIFSDRSLKRDIVPVEWSR
jgi:hypothetical protein